MKKFEEVIDRLQSEAGYATGGYVDRLVYSGLDVHIMLNEIEQAIYEDEEKLATAVKALEDINNGAWHSRNRGLVVDTSDDGTVDLFDFTEKALAEIGGEDE